MVKITSAFVGAAAVAAVSAQSYVLSRFTFAGSAADIVASQTSLQDVLLPFSSLLLVISDNASS